MISCCFLLAFSCPLMFQDASNARTPDLSLSELVAIITKKIDAFPSYSVSSSSWTIGLHAPLKNENYGKYYKNKRASTFIFGTGGRIRKESFLEWLEIGGKKVTEKQAPEHQLFVFDGKSSRVLTGSGTKFDHVVESKGSTLYLRELDPRDHLTDFDYKPITEVLKKTADYTLNQVKLENKLVYEVTSRSFVDATGVERRRFFRIDPSLDFSIVSRSNQIKLKDDSWRVYYGVDWKSWLKVEGFGFFPTKVRVISYIFPDGQNPTLEGESEIVYENWNLGIAATDSQFSAEIPEGATVIDQGTGRDYQRAKTTEAGIRESTETAKKLLDKLASIPENAPSPPVRTRFYLSVLAITVGCLVLLYLGFRLLHYKHKSIRTH